MASLINKKTLKHLTALARFELGEREEERIFKDLQNILTHFKELEELQTEGVEPMAGGTHTTSIFREDVERENTNRGAGVQDFPKTQNGFLKVPSIFENNGGDA